MAVSDREGYQVAIELLIPPSQPGQRRFLETPITNLVEALGSERFDIDPDRSKATGSQLEPLSYDTTELAEANLKFINSYRLVFNRGQVDFIVAFSEIPTEDLGVKPGIHARLSLEINTAPSLDDRLPEENIPYLRTIQRIFLEVYGK